MDEPKPQTRTLRLVVQDLTEKNPLHAKASIWVRGYGTWWKEQFGQPLHRKVYVGKHKKGVCFFYSGNSSRTPGVTVDYEMTAVDYPVGSTAYLIAGTIYIDFYDEQIDVSGVPIGHDAVNIKREERPMVAVKSQGTRIITPLEVLQEKVAGQEERLALLEERLLELGKYIRDQETHAMEQNERR